MKWSVKIGRFAGIDVFMHLSFLLLLGWVALVHWRQGQSVPAALGGVLFILAVFVCVVLHEYGHALMARRYGIRTRDIILLPIGGVARLERLPADPIQELWVALAGPAVNLAIALILLTALWATAAFVPLDRLSLTAGPFLERIMAVNVFMILFNMIPAFPMDGGRVLRAVLAMRGDPARATRIAAAVGQGIAVVFGLVGLFSNPLLLLIALFVWAGAAQEARMARATSWLTTTPVRQIMVHDFDALDVGDNLQRAIDLSLAGRQKDFPVVSDGVLEGMLGHGDLLAALSQRHPEVTVGAVARKPHVTIDAMDGLDTALTRFNECACHTLPVTEGGRLVGLLTTGGLGRYLRIRQAMNN